MTAWEPSVGERVVVDCSLYGAGHTRGTVRRLITDVAGAVTSVWVAFACSYACPTHTGPHTLEFLPEEVEPDITVRYTGGRWTQPTAS